MLFQEMEDKVISPEKAEEAKLKARYPHLGQKPGGSDFLRKRLQKGVSSLLSVGYGQEIPKFLYLWFFSTPQTFAWEKNTASFNFKSVKARGSEIDLHKTNAKLAG